MFDALARFADGNARRIGLFAILFFVLAAALGGSVASRLDPYGADDPATETVEAKERLQDAGLRVPAEPHGAFYIYADCGRDARGYCMQLLEKEAVAATPGVDFGANGTGRYVRFAYTRAMADLEQAAIRIRRFAASSPGA